MVLLLTPLMGTLLLFRCNDKEKLEVFYHEDELLIADYLERHADIYSTMLEVLDITGIRPVLNAYGHYTFFVPDNEAFDKFIAASGHTSIQEFDTDFLKSLIKYHLIGKEIETSYLPNGVLADTTFSGDQLVFTFGEGGLSNITVNGESQITERDIKVSNGFVNRVNTVFSPVFLSLYDQLKTLGNYSTFADALEATGLSDTLSRIYVPLNEEKDIRTRFSLFCESDEVFGQAEISNLQDLVIRYSDSEDLTDPENGLYQFMAYHCLSDVLYLNQLDSFNYNTLAANMLVGVTHSGDIFLNADEDVLSGVKIIRENSNKSAKNGVIHALDKVLEPFEPGPAYFTFDLASYQGIEIGKTYTQKELTTMSGIVAENTGIWYRMSFLDEDSSYLETTSPNIGWTVEFELPAIVKGRYRIRLHWVSDSDRSQNVQTFWDGVQFGPVFTMRQQKRPPMVPPEWLYDFRAIQDIGTVFLDETEPHKIKFFGLTEGLGEFDYLSFWPE